VSRAQGLTWVENSVKNVIPGALYFGYDGNYYETMRNSTNFAGANWVASARMVARDFPDIIFIDVGSTTTDIIPIVDGEVLGLTSDMKRLGASQLVYSGVQRTNVATKLKRIRLDGIDYRVSSELFATTLDVYVLLGEMEPDFNACTPADGKDTGIQSCARRLARVLCSDIEELGMDRINSLAKQVKEAQIAEMMDAVVEVSESNGVRTCVLAGSGEFLARHAIKRLNMHFTSISREYGEDVSAVFPAYAVARLIEEVS